MQNVRQSRKSINVVQLHRDGTARRVVFDSPAVLFDDSLGPERVSHLVQTFERGLQKKNLSQSTLDRAKDVLYLFYDLTMSTRSKIRQFRKNNLMEITCFN